MQLFGRLKPGVTSGQADAEAKPSVCAVAALPPYSLTQGYRRILNSGELPVAGAAKDPRKIR